MTHLEIPLTLANYIADYLDLPGLFLGKWGDKRIEYIHLSQNTGPECLVLKMNGIIYAMLLSAGGIRTLRKLPGDDAIFNLLKTYQQFPSTETTGGMIKTLRATLLFPGGIVQHKINAPSLSGPPSTDLDAAHDNLIKYLLSTMQSQHFLRIKGLHSGDGSFLKRYQLLSRFGQSGLFGQPSAPHDTEYLLIVDFHPLQTTQLQSKFLFLKTKRDFRGLTARTTHATYSMGHVSTSCQSEDEILLELTDPDVNWRMLIEDAHQHPQASEIKMACSVHLLLIDKELACTFTVPTDEQYTVPALWHVLKTLIAQFPER